jgi:hypothetical protein
MHNACRAKIASRQARLSSQTESFPFLALRQRFLWPVFGLGMMPILKINSSCFGTTAGPPVVIRPSPFATDSPIGEAPFRPLSSLCDSVTPWWTLFRIFAKNTKTTPCSSHDSATLGLFHSAICVLHLELHHLCATSAPKLNELAHLCPSFRICRRPCPSENSVYSVYSVHSVQKSENATKPPPKLHHLPEGDGGASVPASRPPDSRAVIQIAFVNDQGG